ncbi:MAG: methyltransferase domain-containing protein [Chlamydiales bacterium]|nr:methyltransferase domain-containing protein [Chlamydiales bacterium]
MKSLFETSIPQANTKKAEVNMPSAMEFIAIGLASQALCLLDASGVLKALKEKEIFYKRQIDNFNNSHLMKAAFLTLVETKVLLSDHEGYKLTRLGHDLVDHIGILTVPLLGYRKLFANQLQILKDPSSTSHKDIDFSALALASNDFGLMDLDPLLLEIFIKLRPKGTICDLGCGSGEKLRKICKATGVPGLGIDQSEQVIKKSRNQTEHFPKIEMITGNITKLENVWEDVELALMCFVCHDIVSFEQCAQVLKSLYVTFPRLRYLVLADIVSPSEKVPTIMPGFDYVHGLQGITTRNYEETLEVFKLANFNVFNEFKVPNMPNTFIWILQPLNNK